MTKQKINNGHSTAFGYAIFGLMWLCIIFVVLYFLLSGTPAQVRAQLILSFLREAWGLMTYLLFMSGINFGMALAVWSVISRPQKTQRLILGVAIFFAIASAVLLIATIASWFVKKFPDWYSPFYNVYPAVLFTFGYCYFAYDLRRVLRISNKAIELDRE
jgi:hypothetical protein